MVIILSLSFTENFTLDITVLWKRKSYNAATKERTGWLAYFGCNFLLFTGTFSYKCLLLKFVQVSICYSTVKNSCKCAPWTGAIFQSLPNQLSAKLKSSRLEHTLVLDVIVLWSTLVVESWCSKWLGKGEISPEVAKWVLNKEARPGVAFGNIKKHKTSNPLRLVTSCCGMAIENLSAFTEFYVQPLARKLPLFI